MADTDTDSVNWQPIRLLLIAASGILLIVLLVIYAPVFWQQHSPEQAFRAFNRDLVRKNYSAAFSMLSQETRRAGNQDGFEAVQQGYIDKYGALQGFEQQGEINTHLQDSSMIAIHEVQIYERGRVRFVMLLKKHASLWEVWGFIEE